MVSAEYPGRGPGSGGPRPLGELLVSLPAAVAYVAGPDLVFEFASDVYRQAFGGRDLIGRPYHEALPELAGRPRFEALRLVLQTSVTAESRPVQEPCRA